MELKMSFSLHFSGNLEISIYVTFFNPCSVCGGATHRAYLVARARAWSWGLKPNFVTLLKITLRIAISVGNFVYAAENHIEDHWETGGMYED